MTARWLIPGNEDAFWELTDGVLDARLDEIERQINHLTARKDAINHALSRAWGNIDAVRWRHSEADKFTEKQLKRFKRKIAERDKP